MKGRKRNIIIFLLFLFALLLFLAFIQIENFENKKKKLDIGNILSFYYSKLICSILDKEDFVIKEEWLEDESGLIDKLPHKITFEENKHLYDDLNQLNISPEKKKRMKEYGISTWETYTKTDEKMHKIMKITMQKLLDQAFIALNKVKNVKNPVIHFRCSDTPFHRSKTYGFQKYCFFEKALKNTEKKLNKKFENVIVLYYMKHHYNEKNEKACEIYLQSLKEFLENLKYSVITQSMSQIDDLATMFYAPLVISTVSSFSFMAGFFGKGEFITAEHHNTNGCRDCNDDWYYKGYNLIEDDIKDYYNTEDVLERLKTC